MRRSRAKSRRRGTVSVIAAFCTVPLLCVTALVLDGSMMLSRQRQTQAVADAVAHAAAVQLAKNYATDSGLDPRGKAASAAQAIATSNSYTSDGTTASVIVNIPPKSGTASGQPGNAEVYVTYYHPRYFSSMFGSGSIPITVRSMGTVTSSTPASIILTDPSSAGALTMTGSGKLTANGAIQVNSSSSGAINMSNAGYLYDNGGTNVVGNYTFPYGTASTWFTKTPATGQPVAADPYSSLAAPSVPSTAGAVTPNPADQYHKANVTPGYFPSGLNLSSGGIAYTMASGLYYVKGNFSVSNGTTLTGSNVTIYLDSSGGSVSFQGGTTVTLTAPTSGAYNGIVYYQDRANTSSLNNIANGSTVNMTGALYAPNAALSIAGGASGASYGTQMIVKSLNLSNGVNVVVNTTMGSSSVSAPFISQ